MNYQKSINRRCCWSRNRKSRSIFCFYKTMYRILVVGRGWRVFCCQQKPLLWKRWWCHSWKDDILPPFQMLLRTYFFSYSIWTTLSLLLLHFWWTFKINLSSGGQYWQIETHYHCYHLYHITPFQTLSDPNLPPSSSGRRDPQLHIVTSGEEIWNNYYTSNTSSTSGPILLYFN